MSQLFEDGKVISVDGVELECVGVSYQEDPETQKRHTFGYTFRPKVELDAERQAEADRIAAEEANAAAPEPIDPVTQPEVNKEETLNVK